MEPWPQIVMDGNAISDIGFPVVLRVVIVGSACQSSYAYVIKKVTSHTSHLFISLFFPLKFIEKNLYKINLTSEDQLIPIPAAVTTKISHETLENFKLVPSSVMYFTEKSFIEHS